MEMVKISELPLDVQRQIPLTIRTFKDEYQLEELPEDIQSLIINTRIISEIAIDKSKTLDVLLDTDQYGDLKSVTNTKDLVLEYLRVFFGLTDGYPFDPRFKSNLKRYLHRRRTPVVERLIQEEVDNIIRVIQADLGVLIRIDNIDIKYYDTNVDINIDLSINSEKVTVSVSSA